MTHAERGLLAWVAGVCVVITAVLCAALLLPQDHSQAAATATVTPPSWAVINVDGTLARSRGATSSTQLGVDGQYNVVFSKNVSQCAYAASGGEATPIGPDDAVVFTVAPSAGNPNAVFVQEWDGVLGVDSYSSGFHLIVTC